VIGRVVWAVAVRSGCMARAELRQDVVDIDGIPFFALFNACLASREK